MKCFVGLQHVGLERKTCVFNTLLKRVAQDKQWEKILHVFRHMLDTGVLVDTDTYNALIGACIRGQSRTLYIGHVCTQDLSGRCFT